MKAKIAVATVSGRAYYKLVNELKAKRVPFLSLKPWDHIPLDVKVVVTSEKEKPSVKHSNIVVFKHEDDPAKVIDEAIRIVKGKRSYEKIVVGIDPGRTFGVAVLGDGSVLETFNFSSLKKTIDVVVKTMQEAPATGCVVKIGDGAPVCTKELLHSLDESLPREVIVQIVSEVGTSHFVKETSHLRGLKDEMSAIKIAGRNGKIFSRKKTT